MSWKLSQFRTGDLVEVRSQEEILATLDQRGALEGMPFMPEMLQYCGKKFRVRAVAHKTCETARQTWTGRRLQATVHLAGLLCDGSAHGGCQAECSLFFKDAWLKPAEKPAPAPVTHKNSGCTLHDLTASILQPDSGAGDKCRYSCQATQLFDATEPLSPSDWKQYYYDVRTGNRTLWHVVRVQTLAILRWMLHRTPIGYNAIKNTHNFLYPRLTGNPIPYVQGKFKVGETTPSLKLNLQPGELVRIKSVAEIEQTIDEHDNNRGLSFDAREMAPYCGKVYRVRRRVTEIIQEGTGKMLKMKQPCITLEEVYCNSWASLCRLNCPRQLPPFWREIWLERVEEPAAQSTSVAAAQPIAAAAETECASECQAS